MGNKYDAILKEKKVYDDWPVDNKHKYFKLSIFFSLLVALLIVVISYVIYFNTVLDNQSIFLNNIEMIKIDYADIFNNIKFPYDLESNHVIEGNIDVGNDNYKYSFQKDANKILRTISNENKNITYYDDGQSSYIKISGLGDFYVKENKKLNSLNRYRKTVKSVKEDFNNYLYSSFLDKNSYELFNQIYNFSNFDAIKKTIKNNYQTNISSDKYIRKVYFDGGRPVVEVSLSLEKGDINSILGESTGLVVKDDYKVNITMKNDAIDNSINSIKIVINNSTKNTREVIEYKNGIIYYTNKNSDKYSINYDASKNTIRIKKNDVLYSFVQIASKNNTSIYTYKVIDKIYTISLSVEKVKNNFSYSIETNIENVPKALKISGEYGNGKSINEDVSKAVSLDSLSIGQQNYYKKSISELLK